ncbi:hypothetical protein ACE6H2_020685 [Prunus campanulata]
MEEETSPTLHLDGEMIDNMTRANVEVAYTNECNPCAFDRGCADPMHVENVGGMKLPNLNVMPIDSSDTF